MGDRSAWLEQKKVCWTEQARTDGVPIGVTKKEKDSKKKNEEARQVKKTG